MHLEKIDAVQQNKVIDKLASSATSKSLVLFCGAGVSRTIDSNMIGWAELLKILNEKEKFFTEQVLEKTYDDGATRNNLTFVLQKYDFDGSELKEPVMYEDFKQLKLI